VERLRQRAEFQRVYAHGVKVSGRFLVLFFLQGENGGVRVGLTATRRLGSAVVRNRCRRRLRELVRRHAGVWSGVTGDIVLNIRKGSAEAAWADLEDDYVRCVGKVLRRRA
jgi:ribonuclease P protein component